MVSRRRYRLFGVCAVVIVFLLYRVVQNSSQELPNFSVLHPQRPLSNAKYESDLASNLPSKGEQDSVGDKTAVSVDPPKGVSSEAESGDPRPTLQDPKNEKTGSSSSDAVTKGVGQSSDDDAQDESTLSTLEKLYGDQKDDQPKNEPLHFIKPPKDAYDGKTTSGYQIHWTSVSQRFPVPTDSLITLPTGTPKTIPKIQYDFGSEPEQQETQREKRLEKVRDEIERAWGGYRKHAWLHDELSPVSGKFRDPFCGWAATLVDSLDTLWIAGLTDQFNEAAKAVKDLDFTWTKRHDIPVFETTIRYLGGLIGAFDVSGGHQGSYPILLDKATEMADILMGIFDTPNRMPLLYYAWQPAFASQPHRASRAGIAELGTLSMEFTRLAQLTGQQRYYDAVARITNALVDFQAAGSNVPGLFPESLDTSGCNRTSGALKQVVSSAADEQIAKNDELEAPQGYVPSSELGAREAIGGVNGADVSKDVKRQVRRSVENSASDSSTGKRSLEARQSSDSERRSPPNARGTHLEWDCVEQGIVALSWGMQSYHLGGGQDSAYEYFPKEYLLLNGLEPKYQKLHEDAVDAIDKWLLFRPMVKGNWDILFPAKVTTLGDIANDVSADYEFTHLTCFVGGMYGLGAKIFGREKDLETAKKLTDACVWAYQSTESGIMPEGFHVMQCPTLERCDFNETAWWDKLVPRPESLKQNVGAWEEQRKEAEEAAIETSKSTDTYRTDASLDTEKAAEAEALKAEALKSEKTGGHLGKVVRRAAIPKDDSIEEASELPDSLREKLNLASDPDTPSRRAKQSMAGAGQAQEAETEEPVAYETLVRQRVVNERLPPGVTRISSRSYILRPEAIESVWYMYRITGDPKWMDKGWTMFEATIRATRTEIANSAVDDVTLAEPGLKDEMESFWLAETLKYYFLLFSKPDVISLDEWVLNTEAHPFRRPTRTGSSLSG